MGLFIRLHDPSFSEDCTLVGEIIESNEIIYHLCDLGAVFFCVGGLGRMWEFGSVVGQEMG